MRTQNLTISLNTYSITYPDEVLMSKDKNYIIAKHTAGNSTDRIGLRVTLVCGNKTETLEYFSPDNNMVMIDISDTLRSFIGSFNNTNASYTITLFKGEFSSQSISNITARIVNGKSLFSRSKCAANIIRTNAFLYGATRIYVFNPFNSSATAVINGQQYGLAVGVNVFNSLTLPTSDFDITITPNNAQTFEFGDLLKGKNAVSSITYHCIIDCISDGYCAISYTNCDGVTQNFHAKVLDIKHKRSATEYNQVQSNSPMVESLSNVYASGTEFELGIEGVLYDEHIEEVMMCDNIAMFVIHSNSAIIETFNAIPMSIDYDADGKTKDVILKCKLI